MNSSEDCKLIGTAYYIRNDDVEADRIGKHIAQILGLQKDRKGLWKTTYGTKTNIGLAKTILTILEEVNE